MDACGHSVGIKAKFVPEHAGGARSLKSSRPEVLNHLRVEPAIGITEHTDTIPKNILQPRFAAANLPNDLFGTEVRECSVGKGMTAQFEPFLRQRPYLGGR
jgi:hypothetical protein